MSNRSISLLSIGSSIKNLSILNLGETNLIAGEICFLSACSIFLILISPYYELANKKTVDVNMILNFVTLLILKKIITGKQ